MESYCVKCKKNTESVDPQVSSNSNGKLINYRSVQHVIVKNLNLLVNKKQKDY